MKVIEGAINGYKNFFGKFLQNNVEVTWAGSVMESTCTTYWCPLFFWNYITLPTDPV